jgi:hypothetical protein
MRHRPRRKELVTAAVRRMLMTKAAVLSIRKRKEVVQEEETVADLAAIQEDQLLARLPLI